MLRPDDRLTAPALLADGRSGRDVFVSRWIFVLPETIDSAACLHIQRLIHL